MNDTDRKLLTEYLGKCWHKWGVRDNRTFTTPDDMVVVKDKLAEKGEWCGFTSYSYSKWRDYVLGLPPDKYNPEMSNDRCSYMFDWLINPTRFCQLAVDFLKENKP